jgi:hypothetical protein
VHAPGLAGERARLVRLCARLTGDPEAKRLADVILTAGTRAPASAGA